MRKNKFYKIFGGLALCAFIGAGMTSCSSDLNEPTPSNPSGDMLVGAPKVIAYSGDHVWTNPSNTRAAGRSEEFGDIVKYETVWKEYGVINYDAEAQVIRPILQEGQYNNNVLDKDFMYHAEEDITFEMFPVMQSTSHSPNYLGVFYYDSEGQLHKEIVWDNINLYNLSDWEHNQGRSRGIRLTIKKGYKFGFFIEGMDEHGVITPYYSLAELNPMSNVFGQNATNNIHAGTFEKNGETYICFEDWVDFDYQDIIFASFAHLPTVDGDDLLPDDEEVDNPVTPDTPEEPEVTPPGDNGDQDGDDDDDSEIVVQTDDEVEINLALDNKNNKYLESHLSMHVRSATDVEVFIPVPAKYYCDADDMNIVLDKVDENLMHGGPYRTEILVGSNSVYLNVEFKTDGIKIWTDGINEEVIDFCRENYNDGITFEVWNYFNDPDKVGELPITMEELKTYLDGATVKFLDKVPGQYVNAFGRENGKYGEGGTTDGNDFHVIPEEQLNRFDTPYEEGHLNGSALNDIYKNKES